MKNKTGAKWLLVGSAAVLVVWASQQFLRIDPESVRNWVVSFGFWSPFVYILIYTVRPLVLIPSSLLSLVGGLAFGAVAGTVYTLIGATLSAILAYVVARLFGERFFRQEWHGLAGENRTNMEKHGFLYVLGLRLVPVVNFDLISYGAGLAGVRFQPFLWATLLGILPGTFAYNFLGSSFVSDDWRIFAAAAALFLLVAAVPFIIRRRRKTRQTE